jgi:hypothetical protein
MANLDDILTATKNAVVALNTINSSINYFSGRITSSTTSSSAVAVTGSGVLVNVSVVTAGTTAGAINDANTTGGATTANTLISIPNTIGVFTCGQHFTKGLVIVPGTGQYINVTYSLDV